jgi:hypothetical protein
MCFLVGVVNPVTLTVTLSTRSVYHSPYASYKNGSSYHIISPLTETTYAMLYYDEAVGSTGGAVNVQLFNTTAFPNGTFQ